MSVTTNFASEKYWFFSKRDVDWYPFHEISLKSLSFFAFNDFVLHFGIPAVILTIPYIITFEMCCIL